MQLFPQRQPQGRAPHPATSGAQRLLIVQYAGDVRQAYYALANGQQETYYAQRYSLDVLTHFQQWHETVGTLIFKTDAAYDDVLPNGIRVIGAGFENSDMDDSRILALVQAFRPTRLVLRTPYRPLLRWAIRHQVKTLVTLADSFQGQRLKDRILNFRLKQLLSSSWIDWVGNHGVNASLSLQSVGLNPGKIIPWDWPAIVTPAAFPPKTHMAHPGSVNLFFAGAIAESKGIGDVLRAVQLLKQQGLKVCLKAAGKGEIITFEQEADRLGITAEVKFLGLVPQAEVVNLMHASDVVIIPSRHSYPEGLPMTIYEGLCSRTPIVASDHPMFRGKLQHEKSALIFPAGNATELAACIVRLHSDSTLYQQLSFVAADAWEKLQIPVKWGELVERWLVDSPENRRWLMERCLSSAIYSAGQHAWQ